MPAPCVGRASPLPPPTHAAVAVQVERALSQRLRAGPSPGAEFVVASAVSSGTLPSAALQLSLNAVLFDPGAAASSTRPRDDLGAGSLHWRCGWIAQAVARLGPDQQRRWMSSACRLAQVEGMWTERSRHCQDTPSLAGE